MPKRSRTFRPVLNYKTDNQHDVKRDQHKQAHYLRSVESLLVYALPELARVSSGVRENYVPLSFRNIVHPMIPLMLSIHLNQNSG